MPSDVPEKIVPHSILRARIVEEAWRTRYLALEARHDGLLPAETSHLGRLNGLLWCAEQLGVNVSGLPWNAT